MDATINLLWTKVLEAGGKLSKENPEQKLVFYYDSEKEFSRQFRDCSDTIKKYMEDPHSFLDRHKVAACIICSVLKADVFGISKKAETKKDTVIFANEIVALNVALSYMYSELQKAFERGEVPYARLFEDYVFPKPYSCDKKYKFVICRDLYFSHTDFDLSPLSIANLLFFLEDYSFVANGIERLDNSNLE